jgi:hypothetical protein
MTREQALSILRDARRTDLPCVIQPNLTQDQAMSKITAGVRELAPGTTLDATLERRVYQVSRNQRRPIIKPNPEATA